MLSVEFSLLEPSNLVTLAIEKCISPTLRRIQIPSAFDRSWFLKQFQSVIGIQNALGMPVCDGIEDLLKTLEPNFINQN